MLLTVIVAMALCAIEIIALVAASPMMKPSFLFSFLHDDVRLAAKDHPEPSKSKQILAYLIYMIFIIAVVGEIIYIGMVGIKNGCGFWKLTLRFMVILYINKAFDILVQDHCISLFLYDKSRILISLLTEVSESGLFLLSSVFLCHLIMLQKGLIRRINSIR